MEVSQWWDPDQIAADSLTRLRHFLAEIGREVPYYRDLFHRIGFDPQDVRSIDDIREVPFLTKAHVRENVEALKHRNAHGLARSNTGGSSGNPLVFFIGKERVSHDVAAKWRATRWWNLDV